MLPKATAYTQATCFDTLTQADIDLLLSHVNSYLRPSLGDATPLALFSREYGPELPALYGVKPVAPNDVWFKPALLGIDVRLKPGILDDDTPAAPASASTPLPPLP